MKEGKGPTREFTGAGATSLATLPTGSINALLFSGLHGKQLVVVVWVDEEREVEGSSGSSIRGGFGILLGIIS